ncbi:MAG: N-acetylmuramoyl-L-alanine amidase [Planctomycetota bacterium]|nr:MAG: N-acetylmuramoyl-L-alanine amidase [Planctomycetota bacterium]
MRAWLIRMMAVFVLVFAGGCSSTRSQGPIARPGDRLERRGDEIVVAGQYFHTGAPVVLWTDPGGYDAYRVERRFARMDESGWDSIKDGLPSPNRYNQRLTGDPAMDEANRGGGWELDDLRGVVDQFVLHYDVCGTSRTCFRVLHDLRGLSVHFMLDIDGTIYQTLDVKERAWHATKANTRSVGIEIANIGAYPSSDSPPLQEWYTRDAQGRTRITLPARFGDGGLRAPGRAGRPSRDDPVSGVINDSELVMYDLTDAQYESLIRLTAALHRALPEIRLDYPRAPGGGVLPRALDDDEFRSFRGVLGHWHVQENKVDPGPALDWERVVGGARELLSR